MIIDKTITSTEKINDADKKTLFINLLSKAPASHMLHIKSEINIRKENIPLKIFSVFIASLFLLHHIIFCFLSYIKTMKLHLR